MTLTKRAWFLTFFCHLQNLPCDNLRSQKARSCLQSLMATSDFIRPATKGIFSKKNDCLSAKLKWRNSPFLLTFAPISRLWLKTTKIIARRTSLFLQSIFFVSRISIDEFPLLSKITWVGKNYTFLYNFI